MVCQGQRFEAAAKTFGSGSTLAIKVQLSSVKLDKEFRNLTGGRTKKRISKAGGIIEKADRDCLSLSTAIPSEALLVYAWLVRRSFITI
jgi:hypothetical protein